LFHALHLRSLTVAALTGLWDSFVSRELQHPINFSFSRLPLTLRPAPRLGRPDGVAMQRTALEVFVGRRVVLDTQGPLLYIGRLESFDERGYWLTDADVHDRHDGHSTKEQYISEAKTLERSGASHANRRRVFVERHAIVSVSALDDVVIEPAEE
jgi:hypothetical protein